MQNDGILNPPPPALVLSRERPRLRGVSHQLAFFIAAAAGIGLLSVASAGRPTVAVGIYVISLMALFGVSALYHRVTWADRPRAFMKRLDHSVIFVFIAGTTTPMALLAMEPAAGQKLLLSVWAGALIGIARAIFWPGAPKWLTASTYVAVGWISAAFIPEMYAGIGFSGMSALLVGGLIYSVGAAVYATRRPDPFPTIFGYHEVFHALVILACVLHFVMITAIVTAT